MSTTSIRVAHRELKWYGFDVPVGAAYGTSLFKNNNLKRGEYDYVYLGKKRPAYFNNKNSHGTEIQIFLHPHVEALSNSADACIYKGRWLDCTGDSFLLKLLGMRIEVKNASKYSFNSIIDKAAYDELLKKYKTNLEELSKYKRKVSNIKSEEKQVISRHALIKRFSKLVYYDESNSSDTQMNTACNLNLKHLSFFRVIKTEDTSFPYRIVRLVDVDEVGCLTLFDDKNTSETNLHTYYKFRYKQGPQKENAYGMWYWDILQNQRDVEKIYIDSEYVENLSPILIVENGRVENTIEMINEKLKLKDKLNIMASVRIDEYKFFGALINLNNLTKYNDSYIITEGIDYLEGYTFDEDDIIYIDGKPFLNRLNPGKPVGRYYLRPIEDIVINIISEKVNWNLFKDQGITRKDWKSIKHVLSTIKDASLSEEIKQAVLCSDDMVKEYVSKYITRIEQRISDKSLDNEIMLEILNQNDKIRDFYYGYAEQHWRDENQPLISEMELQLKELEDKLSTKTFQLNGIEGQIRTKQETLKKYDESISEKKAVYDDYDSKIKQNLNEARNSIIELLGGAGGMSVIKSNYITHNRFEKTEELTYSDHHELCDILAENVEYLGVNREFSFELALIIYSSFINNIPLLLAGPNAEYIGEALSISLFGKSAGIVDCIENTEVCDTNEIIKSDDKVIVFKNALTGEWINRIIDLIDKTDKYFVLTSNFGEDLVLEPKGILNYLIPLVTEIFIDEKKKENFVFGQATEDYRHFSLTGRKKYSHNIIDSVGLNTMEKTNIIRVLSTMQQLLEKETDFDVSVFAAVSLITSKRDNVMEYIQNRSINKQLKKRVEEFLGDDQ